MEDEEFRALLDWFMCSDPWPIPKDMVGDDHQATIEALLNKESINRGYADWVDAYHCFSNPSKVN